MSVPTTPKPKNPKPPDDELSVEFGRWKALAKGRFAILALVFLAVAQWALPALGRLLGCGSRKKPMAAIAFVAVTGMILITHGFVRDPQDASGSVWRGFSI